LNIRHRIQLLMLDNVSRAWDLLHLGRTGCCAGHEKYFTQVE
jgi:hypothetical protein